MGIQRGQHSTDRALDQILGFDILDVMFLDLGQDLRERFQFLVCLGRMAGSLPAFSDQDSEEQSHHNDRPQIPSPALPFLFHSDSFLSL